jgi:hypothetical protein
VEVTIFHSAQIFAGKSRLGRLKTARLRHSPCKTCALIEWLLDSHDYIVLYETIPIELLSQRRTVMKSTELIGHKGISACSLLARPVERNYPSWH